MKNRKPTQEYIEWITEEIEYRKTRKENDRVEQELDTQNQLKAEFKNVYEDYKETEEWD